MAIYRQATAPAYEAGGLWFDSDDNDKPYYGSGGSWVALNPGSLFTDFSDTDHVQDADVLLGQRGSGGVNYLGSHFAKKAANGNFGVGEEMAAPRTKFQVSGSFSVTASGGPQFILLGNRDSFGSDGPSVIVAANKSLSFGVGDSWAVNGNGGSYTRHLDIDQNGNVGLGSQFPAAALEILRPRADMLRLFNNGGFGTEIQFLDLGWQAKISHNAGSLSFKTGGGGTESLKIDTSGACIFPNGTVFRPGASGQFIVQSDSGGFYHQVGSNYYTVTTSGGSTSDRRRKKNIKGLAGMLDKVISLRGVSYERKWKKSELVDNAEDGLCIGLIAQEVEDVFPEVVNGEEGQKTLQYDRLIAPMIEAFKEYVLKTDLIISNMSARLAELEARK